MGMRSEDRYVVTDDERQPFAEDGYVHLAGVLTEDEVAALDPVYDAFMRGEIDVVGRDLYDMVTGEFGTDPAHDAIFNVMLPRKYYPEWQGNVFERVGSVEVVPQVFGQPVHSDRRTRSNRKQCQ